VRETILGEEVHFETEPATKTKTIGGPKYSAIRPFFENHDVVPILAGSK
jgi:hypothetical protein